MNAVPGAGVEGLADGAAGGRVPHRTVPSPSALASSVPSGLNATPSTPYRALVAWRGWPTGRPVAVFHSRTVPSPSALASSVPSGLNATPHAAVPGRWCRSEGRADGLAGGDSTAAPCRRHRRWPAASRRG